MAGGRAGRRGGANMLAAVLAALALALVVLPTRSHAASTAVATAAEERATLAALLMRLAGIPAPTGDEWPLRDTLAAEFTAAGASARPDGLGNLLINTGAWSGEPWLFLMALDDPTYAVSGIDAGGWLAVVPLARPPLPAAMHAHLAGSAVWVMGDEGALPGVVALPSIHLQGGRAGFPPPASEEYLHIDVGTDAAAGELASGAVGGQAHLVDRVVARGEPALLAGRAAAGWGVAQRGAATAALLSVQRRAPGPPVIMVAQSRFGGRGKESIGSLLADLAAAGGKVIILEAAEGDVFQVAAVSAGGGGEASPSPLADAVVKHLAAASVPQVTERAADVERPALLPPGAAIEAAVLRYPVSRRDTLGETVALDTVVALTDLMAAAPRRSGSQRRQAPLSAAAIELRAWQVPVDLQPADPAQPFAHLPALVEAAGVAGAEMEVVATIRRLLPRAYASRLVEDSDGNLLLTLGDGAPHRLFVAHMDETGYRVKGIREDGRLQVEKRGGFYDSALLHRPLQVHTRTAAVPGVLDILPEVLAEAEAETLSAAAAWPLVRTLPASRLVVDVGAADSVEATAMGIVVGDGVTVPKRFRRLGAHRGYGRGIDDRAGCAALIAALHRLEGEQAAGRRLIGTASFAWVVREEIGLEGARALAAHLVPDEVYAVDTFVSSDSPLERRFFGDAPLGEGAVLRAIDSSNIAPMDLVRRVRELAAGLGVALQSGAGRGGNDGSVFARHGIPGLPLSWPGRYSHSAVEVIDSRDHDALTRLIVLLATTRF